MSSYRTEIHNITYNAAERHFEALVVFHEGHETHKMPISAPLPISTDFAQVSDVLVARAKSRRAKGRARLTSRAPAKTAPKLVHVKTMIQQFKDAMGLPETNADTQQAA